MRRPRLTIRTMMALVALAALLIGGGMWGMKMRRRSDFFRKEASRYALGETLSLHEARLLEELAANVEEHADDPATARRTADDWRRLSLRDRQKAVKYAALKRAYEEFRPLSLVGRAEGAAQAQAQAKVNRRSPSPGLLTKSGASGHLARKAERWRNEDMLTRT